jgi:Zn-finger nucleic acid-binding protein
MFVGSRFCARCGAEAKHEVLEDAKPLPCPRCREPMELLRLGETTVRSCGACGGLWLDPQSLQQLCDTREDHAGVVSLLAARVPTSTVTPDVVRYVPCPSCKKLMNRVNFAHSSGVILDVCKADGVWLDRGELQRVIGFVEAGGLTVAREHERDRLVEEQRKLALQQAFQGQGVPSQPGFSFHVRWSTKSESAVGDAFESLLGDAIGLIYPK